jgi:hypothetical protein
LYLIGDGVEMIDYEKCSKCDISLNHCDGITRYKCGTKRKDVKKHCILKD